MATNTLRSSGVVKILHGLEKEKKHYHEYTTFLAGRLHHFYFPLSMASSDQKKPPTTDVGEHLGS